MLADAKYIGRVALDQMLVDAGDVNEGLAFLRAAECDKLVLLYPRRHRAGLESQPVGTSTHFEHIEVDGYNIYGYEVEVKGISAKGGFRAFAQGIGMRSACTSS